MGLPVWSSLGYGDDDKPASATKPEPSAPRSPIRRRSPMRSGSIRDPETGERRTFRRPLQVARPTFESVGRLNRSPLVPSIPPELREALTSTMRRIASRTSDAEDLEASLTSRPPRNRAISQAALERALRACSMFRRNMRDFRLTVERWEQMAMRGNLGTGVNPSDVVNELNMMRLEVNHEMDNVFAVYEDARNWPAGTSAFLNSSRTRARSDSPRPMGSPGLDVQPLSPTLIEAALASNELPPLRRMGHRSITEIPTPLPRSRLSESSLVSLDVPSPPLVSGRDLSNGLGDRTRSTSPDGEAGAWDTMLMTMEPDARLPSADSSFTSAAASASFTGNHSGAPPATLNLSAPELASLPTPEILSISASSSGNLSARLSNSSAGSSHTHLTVPSAEDTACESDEERFEPSDYPRSPLRRGHIRRGRNWRVGHSARMRWREESAEASNSSVDNTISFQGAHQTRLRTSEVMPEMHYRRAENLYRSRLGVRSDAVDGTRSDAVDFVRTYYESGFGQNGSRSGAEHTDATGANLTTASRSLTDLPRTESPVSMFSQADRRALSHSVNAMEFTQNNEPEAIQEAIDAAVFDAAVLRHRAELARAELVAVESRLSGDSSPSDPLADPQIEHMRSILERMASSRSIPEEWWMSAGLTPTIVQNSTGSGSGNGSENITVDFGFQTSGFGISRGSGNSSQPHERNE